MPSKRSSEVRPFGTTLLSVMARFDRAEDRIAAE